MLDGTNYHSNYGIYNIATGQRLTNDLEIHFLEIPKWHFSNTKQLNRLERWLAYFSDKLSAVEFNELVKNDPAIQKALEVEKVFTQDQILRRQYEQREKAIMDYNSAMSSARKDGIEQGIISVARNMLATGMPVQTVADLTKLPADAVAKLLQ